ncbi:MAG: BatD family protein, partial [Muribaculaceae bacterium]|nr:BatD family protein [Muribaculaceae bacterium]
TASIDVTPLPQPQPAGFNGAVGRFNIDSRLVGNSFRTNEAATLIYTITGTGNIKYLKEPEIDFPSEFELYTPRTDSNTRVSGNNMTGSMTIEYTFVPQSVGDFNIGANTFVYFDPSKKEYVTLHTSPYDIKVQQGASVSSSVNSAQQDITAKNTDILHIKLGDKNPAKTHSYTIYSAWYWIVIILAAIALVGIVMLNARAIKASADEQGRKTARAGKEAKKRLKAAGTALHRGSYDEFYAELLKALMGYLGDKLGLPASQLSRDNVDAALSERGIGSDILDSLHQVIDECEMARYTPQSSPEKAEAVYNNATAIINQMESVKLKKNK